MRIKAFDAFLIIFFKICSNSEARAGDYSFISRRSHSYNFSRTWFLFHQLYDCYQCKYKSG